VRASVATNHWLSAGAGGAHLSERPNVKGLECCTKMLMCRRVAATHPDASIHLAGVAKQLGDPLSASAKPATSPDMDCQDGRYRRTCRCGGNASWVHYLDMLFPAVAAGSRHAGLGTHDFEADPSCTKDDQLKIVSTDDYLSRVSKEPR
jgi:hypothetical protein